MTSILLQLLAGSTLCIFDKVDVRTAQLGDNTLGPILSCLLVTSLCAVQDCSNSAMRLSTGAITMSTVVHGSSSSLAIYKTHTYESIRMTQPPGTLESRRLTFEFGAATSCRQSTCLSIDMFNLDIFARPEKVPQLCPVVYFGPLLNLIIFSNEWASTS